MHRSHETRIRNIKPQKKRKNGGMRKGKREEDVIKRKKRKM